MAELVNWSNLPADNTPCGSWWQVNTPTLAKLVYLLESRGVSLSTDELKEYKLPPATLAISKPPPPTWSTPDITKPHYSVWLSALPTGDNAPPLAETLRVPVQREGTFGGLCLSGGPGSWKFGAQSVALQKIERSTDHLETELYIHSQLTHNNIIGKAATPSPCSAMFQACPTIFRLYSTIFQSYSTTFHHIPAIFHHIPPYSSRIPQHSAIFGPVNPAGSGVVALTTLLHWAPPSPHTLRQVLFFAVTPTFDSATPKRMYHPNVQVCDLGTFVTTALFLLLPYLTRQQ